VPSSSPSETPGFDGAFSARQASAIAAALACQRARSSPIAAAGTTPNGEHAAEAVTRGDRLEPRSGIGDSDEPTTGLCRADALHHPLEEIGLEDVRLECRARLACHDHNR